MNKFIFITLVLFAGSANGACYHYYYFSSAQQYIKAPSPMPHLGRFVGKKNRKCEATEKKSDPKFLSKGEYELLAITASKKHGIESDLILAVIKAESFFDVNAVSPKGAKGLMQLMDSNIAIYGVKDPFNPVENVNAGAALLSKLSKVYKGDLDLMLAAYNAGEGAVSKYNGVPPYNETTNYITKVKRYLNELKQS